MHPLPSSSFPLVVFPRGDFEPLPQCRRNHGCGYGVIRRAAIAALVLAAAGGAAMANGGGYESGGVTRAGDVAGFEPKATELVLMLDEKLTIDLGPQEAAVDIRYLMRNLTDRKVTVTFGFPVEESVSRTDFGDPAKQPKAQTSPAYCQDYRITARGKPLKSAWQTEPGNAADARRRGLAGWYVSSLTFAAGEEIPVAIRFRSAYPRVGQSVSDDGYTSAAVFKYRLSTAACWAGSIGTGRIVLKPDGIDPGDLRVLKPVNRFRKEGESWVWDFENLEPTLADDLEIEAVPEENSYSRPADGDAGNGPSVTYWERAGKWSVSHANYRAKASSTLPPEGERSYGVEHLKAREGTWAEGAPGPGVGEWLELQPVVPNPLLSLTLLPGFDASDELFQANARPKRVRIVLNGEHSFVASVPDRKGAFSIPVTGYSKPVRTVKLVFEEVWPGRRFEDLCVSRIWLESRLAKPPKITPQR
ncbi:MAG: DUF4424 domain-containing protein [Akkermansiaceae bacterium]|jgi:hypothetical protein|nr:DUF4424 domain-containing protein [Akkermansiaceae bacterium]